MILCKAKILGWLPLVLAASIASAQGDQYLVLSGNSELSISGLPNSVHRDAHDPALVWADLRLTSKAKFFLPKTSLGHKWRSIDMRALMACGTEPKLWAMESYVRDSSGRTVEQRVSQDRLQVAVSSVPPGSLNAFAVMWACAHAPEMTTGPQSSEASKAGVAASESEATSATVSASKSPIAQHPVSEAVSGTAFAITHSGFLLTNNHVINGCDDVTLTGADGTQAQARIAFRDERNDLALLAAKGALQDIAVFRRTPIRSGEDVVALGFPYRGLLATDVNVSTGIVSAMAGIRNDSSRLQISAPVQPGNSGGPLIDHTGSVVGVVVAKLDALVVAKAIGDIPQNVNFAIKAEPAISFIQSSGLEPAMAAMNSKSIPIADSVQAARRYTYLVECISTSQADRRR